MKNKMKQLRVAAGLTQLEVAEELGITRQALAAWESGVSVPSLRSAVELADVLEVSVDALVGREVPELEHLRKAAHDARWDEVVGTLRILCEHVERGWDDGR